MRGSDQRTSDFCSSMSTSRGVCLLGTRWGDPAHCQRCADRTRCGLHQAVCGHRASHDAPERLLRALLLQAVYSIRSERKRIELLGYNLLYRWLVGLGVAPSLTAPARASFTRPARVETRGKSKISAKAGEKSPKGLQTY
jgi:hypothetical protein